MLSRQLLIAVIACGFAVAATGVAQEKSGESWRFRFPESRRDAIAQETVSERRIDVASRPSTAKFKFRDRVDRSDPKPADDQRPRKIAVPSLADSRIVIPSTSHKSDLASDNETLGKTTDGKPNSDSSGPEALVADASTGAPEPNPYQVVPAQFSNPQAGVGGGRRLFGPFSRRGRFWVRAEYLYWWAEGMRVPPLVTASPSGTPRDEAAILGESGTQILYGGNEINDGLESGYRLIGGMALDPRGAWHLEGEYFRFEDRTDGFFAQSDDTFNPTNIIGRPFFDVANGRDTAQLVSFDDVVSGSIRVGASSRLQSGGLWGRAATCPCPGPCDVIAINSPLANRMGRFDVLMGYRYANLKDSIAISEDLRSLDAANPGSFQIEDGFQSDNQFHGIELGMLYQGTWRRFTTELITRVAVGNNQQTVSINGYSDIVEAGFLERFPGGILAQRTNIGKYKRNELAIVPQLAFNLDTAITSWLSFHIGYSLFYFSNVVRAGDHIDTDLNPNLFPPEQLPLVTDPLRPRFAFDATDYWAHGVTIGTDFRF